MTVLHVEDRILVVLRDGQIKVKLDHAFRRTRKQVEVDCIRANLFHHVTDGDEVALALAEFDFLAVAHQFDEVVEHNDQPPGSIPSARMTAAMRGTCPWWSTAQTFKTVSKPRRTNLS